MVNQSNEEKIRKKEQNRIASKRFRERRRIELSRCKEEALHYEVSFYTSRSPVQNLFLDYLHMVFF